MSIHKSKQLRTKLSALAYAARLLAALDTPVSLGVYLRMKYRKWDELARLTVKAQDYIDPLCFFKDYQSIKVLSKYPYLDTTISPRKTAVQKFIECENSCLLTNERFRARASGDLFHTDIESVLSVAQRKIAQILGPLPKLEKLDFRFGPGAAYGVRGETSVYNKVIASPECTYAFVDTLQVFLEEFPGWFPEGSIQTVSLLYGSQLTFVPKDAKTDRPICIEPLLNGLYQKGFGSYLRNRLNLFGLNLNDQGVNQKLASLAHSCRLSTVDFSSASDTISYSLVLDLLPCEWFEALDVARSPSFEYEGVWRTFQKFSSMGNAYTFELETLIFFALAFAVCEVLDIPTFTGENISVYGDDVIIPRDAYDLFSEVSIACGFSFNFEKSFKDGSFFESCGCDYFDGYLVRPFLLKSKLEKLTTSFYAINLTDKISERIQKIQSDKSESFTGNRYSYTNLSVSTHRSLLAISSMRDWCIGLVPEALRLYGPKDYGDGHIHADVDFCLRHKYTHRHSVFDAWAFRSYVERARIIGLSSHPMAYALYNTRALVHGYMPCISDEPDLLTPSSGYGVRGKTVTSRSRLLCHFEWRS